MSRKKQINDIMTIIRDNALLDRKKAETKSGWLADLVYEEGGFGIYIGGIDDAVNIAGMRELNVSAVLNMCFVT